MIRLAIVAYLSLTTVLGPALCCCNLAQVFNVGSHRNCCETRVVAIDHRSHSTSPAQRKHHCCSDKADQSSAEGSNLPKSPQDQHRRDCPCGRHQAKLVLATASDTLGSRLNSDSSPMFTFGFDAQMLPMDTKLSVRDREDGNDIRPAGLYGRELLRAYQTLRC